VALNRSCIWQFSHYLQSRQGQRESVNINAVSAQNCATHHAPLKNTREPILERSHISARFVEKRSVTSLPETITWLHMAIQVCLPSWWIIKKTKCFFLDVCCVLVFYVFCAQGELLWPAFVRRFARQLQILQTMKEHTQEKNRFSAKFAENVLISPAIRNDTWLHI